MQRRKLYGNQPTFLQFPWIRRHLQSTQVLEILNYWMYWPKDLPSNVQRGPSSSAVSPRVNIGSIVYKDFNGLFVPTSSCLVNRLPSIVIALLNNFSFLRNLLAQCLDVSMRSGAMRFVFIRIRGLQKWEKVTPSMSDKEGCS